MKKTLLSMAAILFVTFAYAESNVQKAETDEEIELPDLTTIISGGALTAGKDSVPDYKNILPEPKNGGLELPQMEKVQKPKENEAGFISASGEERSVYAEGKIGGGFPFSFLGDFSIYRTTGNSPFSIMFRHESLEGAGDNKACNGYFDRITEVSVIKEYNTARAGNRVSGKYLMHNDGLQGKSDSFTDEVMHSLSGDYQGSWNLANGMYLNYGIAGEYFGRYGNAFKDSAEPSFSWEKDARILDLAPSAGFGWNNQAVRLGFDVLYGSTLNLKSSGTLLEASDSSSAESSHRVQVKAGSDWQLNNCLLYANASAVFGTETGDLPVIVPFTIGLKLVFPAQEAFRGAVITAEGGCTSRQLKIRQIEETYRYAVCPSIPTETTDWYGKLDFSVPVTEIVSMDFSGTFEKTAFDKGIWAPDYKDETWLTSGYYVVSQQNRKNLNTSAGIIFDYGQLKLAATWKSFWMDVPVLEETQTAGAKIMYQTKDGKWSGTASVLQAAGKDSDFVTRVDCEGAVKAGQSIRLALEAKDIIKLVSNKTRTFAHSKYEGRSGSICALAKFQF